MGLTLKIGVGPVIASLSLGSAGLMSFKRKIPKSNRSSHILTQEDSHRARNTKTAPTVLKLLMKHGDIVLQVGSELQTKWLHAIATEGFRIGLCSLN